MRNESLPHDDLPHNDVLDVTNNNNSVANDVTATVASATSLRTTQHDQISNDNIDSDPNRINNNSKRSISIYYQNVRGLRTKSTDFYLATVASNFDIIALTETWFTPALLSTEYFHSDYVVHRCDRSPSTSQFGRGGGVVVAVTKTINTQQIVLPQCENVEYVCVKLKFNRQTIFIYCLYVSSTLSREDKTIAFRTHIDAINRLNSMNSDIVYILGDFNLPNIDWMMDAETGHLMPTNVSTELELLVIDSLLGWDLIQVNNITNHNDRILDLVFTNDYSNSTLIPSSTSIDNHHPPLEIIVDFLDFIISSVDHSDTIFNFRKANMSGLSQHLQSLNFEHITAAPDVDISVELFYNLVHDAFKKFVPYKKTRTNNHPPWHNAHIAQLKNQKNKAHKNYIAHRTQSNYDLLTAARHNYTVTQRYYYNIYIADIEAELISNPKRFWSYVNLKKKTSGYPATMSLSSTTATGEADIAKLFAKFFQGNFSSHTEDVESDTEVVLNNGDALRELQVDEVRATLPSLDPSKGDGPDHMPPITFKECADSLAPPLTCIFNKSLTSGHFPTAWKTSYVTPIYKSGSRLDISNYRGVAILPTIGKLFELLVYKQLAPIIHSQLHNSQHGFTPNRSCTTNLLQFTTNVIPAMEGGQQVDVLFADFTKAFDRVPHHLLIRKLRRAELDQKTISWIRSYLSDRRQFVRIGFHESTAYTVKSGVPQGSHIGPLLFTWFINDLSTILIVLHLLYADDLKMFSRIKSVTDCNQLQRDIDVLTRWCDENGLELNKMKCKIMTLHRKKNPIMFNYNIAGTLLERVRTYSDLGVVIDEKMSFTTHYDTIIAKANSMLGFIKRICSNMNEPYAIKSLYTAFVRSRLEFASLAAILCKTH